MLKKLFIIIIIPLVFSCSKEDDTIASAIKIVSGGVFIVNEGNFSAANSSLSYYNPGDSEISNNLFYKVNNVPLGDVAQSITINQNKVYMVINNSGIIYGINRETLEFDGKISGLISPRNIIFIDDQKAYVSDLYRPELVIVNPSTYEITGKIELGKSSDCMVRLENKVIAANWSAYNQASINNTVMIVNSDTDLMIDSVVVGIEPNSMVIDKDKFLWVLCSGGYLNNEVPTLWKINTNSYEVDHKFTFSNILQNPENLCINNSGDSVFFLNDGIFGMSAYDMELPNNFIIPENNRNFYSLGISPDSEIYVSDALNYNQNGIIFRYSTTGNLISSFEAGIIPGCFEFN